MEEIKIKYLADIEHIEKITQGDWIDLRCAEDIFIPVGTERLVPLGVAMQLPKGYEALVVPRSSTFKRWGIIQTNHVGVIDESYCGDNDQWHFPCYCLIGRTVKDGYLGTQLYKGDRICQFRIIRHQPDLAMVEVDSLGNADRGSLGSTGR